jgi:hypothetical protein
MVLEEVRSEMQALCERNVQGASWASTAKDEEMLGMKAQGGIGRQSGTKVLLLQKGVGEWDWWKADVVDFHAAAN